MDKHVSPGQLRKQFDLMDQKNMTHDRFQQLLDTGILADIFDPVANLDRDALRAALKLGTALPETIRIAVDYGQGLEQMIAAGHYDWKNGDITAKRFPIKGIGRVEFEWKLYHFDRDIESDEAEKLIEQDGWDVGATEHLLAFGAKFPEEQRKYPIIALGSAAKVNGNRHVPYLGRYDTYRLLNLGWWGDRWRRSCRFLAVRKVLES